MSGHSKWNNIKHKKEKSDAQRAKIFTKIGREMAVCVKEGGPDPEANSKLRDLIFKAKANNVPNENIERIIKKAAGDGARADYETIFYEGYGPNGVAIIVETLTENRNRTAGDMRHFFDKFGGNLGQTGCVGWMFTAQGVIVVDKAGVDEDKLMEDSLEAGASDFNADDDIFEIMTDINDVSRVREALQQKKYTILSADEERIPSNYVHLDSEDDIKKMNLLLEHLDDDDDVQNVWNNWENPTEEE